MYDIKPLEEQWERYSKKRKRPIYYAIVAVVIVILILLKLFIFSTPVDEKVLTDVNSSNVSVDSKSKKSIELNATFDNNKTTLKVTVDSNNPMEPEDVYVDEEATNNVPVVQDKVLPKRKKKIHFVMTDANNPSAYKSIEHRFEMGPNSDDSLFLARLYFEKKDYAKAEYWALQTNKLDDQIEESWIIFVKSKVKNGQKNEAIHILKEYILKSKSIRAKKLLNKILSSKSSNSLSQTQSTIDQASTNNGLNY